MFETPILLIAFNRPSQTGAVIERLKKLKPKKLFVAIDAPREENFADQSSVSEVKQIIQTKIDWPCEVKTLFQAKNLGCGYGPVAAITWFFNQVEKGIILEDDCVPDQSFFRFCDELLGRYADNQKILHISGNNYQDGKQRGSYSYYFSKYTHNWGWASWKRAWAHFDHSLIPPEERSHVWDAAWETSVRRVGGYAILPQVNLVQNIGSGSSATHTKNQTDTQYPVGAVSFPLRHPPVVRWNWQADYYTYRQHFNYSLLKSFLARIKK